MIGRSVEVPSAAVDFPALSRPHSDFAAKTTWNAQSVPNGFQLLTLYTTMLNPFRFVLAVRLVFSPDSDQSRARYLVRELLKCLAHRPGDDGNGRADGDVDVDDGDADLDDDQEEEEGGIENDDLCCPLQACERLKEFETLKDLQRHYAIRTNAGVEVVVRSEPLECRSERTRPDAQGAL